MCISNHTYDYLNVGTRQRYCLHCIGAYSNTFSRQKIEILISTTEILVSFHFTNVSFSKVGNKAQIQKWKIVLIQSQVTCRSDRATLNRDWGCSWKSRFLLGSRHQFQHMYVKASPHQQAILGHQQGIGEFDSIWHCLLEASTKFYRLRTQSYWMVPLPSSDASCKLSLPPVLLANRLQIRGSQDSLCGSDSFARAVHRTY